jgi:hypothetical protein
MCGDCTPRLPDFVLFPQQFLNPCRLQGCCSPDTPLVLQVQYQFCTNLVWALYIQALNVDRIAPFQANALQYVLDGFFKAAKVRSPSCRHLQLATHSLTTAQLLPHAAQAEDGATWHVLHGKLNFLPAFWTWRCCHTMMRLAFRTMVSSLDIAPHLRSRYHPTSTICSTLP